MNDINILAIDLAKNVFQVCKLDSKGKVIFNRELSRAKLKELLIKQSPSLVAMEACGSAQYWARLALDLGHQVKIISARTVKPFQTKQKTDRNDALAIAIAAVQEHIHGARVQSVEEQSLQSLERARHLAQAHQIAQSNQIRGLLGEFGLIVPPSLSQLRSTFLSFWKTLKMAYLALFVKLLIICGSTCYNKSNILPFWSTNSKKR